MSSKILVRVKENLEHLSSYDKEMEEFVSSKKDRIIEVSAVKHDDTTWYYECDELPYWKFLDFMFDVITKEDSLKEISDLLVMQDISIDDVVEYEIKRLEKVVEDTYSDIFPKEYGRVGTTEDIYKIREDYWAKIDKLKKLQEVA